MGKDMPEAVGERISSKASELRKSVTLVVFLLLGLVLGIPIGIFVLRESAENVTDTALLLKEGTGCKLSMRESYGFFCESDDDWKRRRELHLKQMEAKKPYWYMKKVSHERFWQFYWQIFHEPSFSCRFEKRIGPVGEGGKWLCDPYRLKEFASTSNCLIYSIGSNNQFGFEAAVHEEFPDCEIHTFDHSVKEPKPPPFVNYHPWGVGGSSNPNSNLYTLNELQKMLGHTSEGKKKIEILKMDVEGFEYEALTELLEVEGIRNVRQMLLELHPGRDDNGSYVDYRAGASWLPSMQKVERFFTAADANGWVITHKEANTLAYGNCIEYVFVKLSTEFTEKEEII